MKSVKRSIWGVESHRGKGAVRRLNEKVRVEMYGRTLKRSGEWNIGKDYLKEHEIKSET